MSDSCTLSQIMSFLVHFVWFLHEQIQTSSLNRLNKPILTLHVWIQHQCDFENIHAAIPLVASARTILQGCYKPTSTTSQTRIVYADGWRPPCWKAQIASYWLHCMQTHHQRNRSRLHKLGQDNRRYGKQSSKQRSIWQSRSWQSIKQFTL